MYQAEVVILENDGYTVIREQMCETYMLAQKIGENSGHKFRINEHF